MRYQDKLETLTKTNIKHKYGNYADSPQNNFIYQSKYLQGT